MNDILTLLTSHNYLALALFALVYVRKLLSSDSKFPLSVSPQWLPAITGLLGVGYAAVNDLIAHKAVMTTVIDALTVGGTTGVADALLTAVFSSANAPKWARALVFIFDDLTGQTPTPPTTTSSTAAKVSMLLPFALAASLSMSQVSCASTLKPLPDPIPQDIQAVVACVVPLLAEGVTDPAKLEAACAPGQDQLIIDVLVLLGESKTLNPSVSAAARVGAIEGIRSFLKKQRSPMQFEIEP